MLGTRFSLRGLFGVVSFLAVSCGLIIYATPLLAIATFSAMLVVMLTAILGAIYNRGDRRAFWTGFALFGFAYVWLFCGNWQMLDGSGHPRDHLLSTTFLTWCYSKAPFTRTTSTMVPLTPGISGMTGPAPMMVRGMMPGGSPAMTMTTVATPPDWSAFMTTGHSLFTLAFAFFGGVIARRGHRRLAGRSEADLVKSG
ncbi:MAG TPA: hypothetical protein VHC22_27420 [Pirellulales bacterium]|nr:hypothetical protein [Pirellulales bacterium]